MFSTNSMASYEEALATAMRSSSSLGETPAGGTTTGRINMDATVAQSATATGAAKAPLLRPAAVDSVTGSSNHATSTFLNSTDILTQHRRAVKSSPPPPKRASVQRPAPNAPTRPEAPLVGKHDPRTQTLPNTAVQDLSTSTLSTVSDAGTAGSVGGGVPYKTHTVSDASRHASRPQGERASIDDEPSPPALTQQRDGCLKQEALPEAVAGRALPSNHVASSRATPVSSCGEDAHADDAPLVTQSTHVFSSASHPHNNHGATPPQRHRRAWAMATIGSWVDGLRWKAKWWSPFATVVRGQIQEAQAMLRDPSFDAIPSASLWTQIHVWQAQLIQFLESPQTSAKWSYLIQHVYHRDASVGSVHRSVRESPRATSRSRSAPVAAADADHSIPEAAEGSAHGASAAVLPQRRTPIKMLRRGDGLRGRGVDKISAPSLHHTGSSGTNGPTVKQLASVAHDAAIAAVHTTDSPPQPKAPKGVPEKQVPLVKTTYTIPTVLPEERKTARSIAAFLAHVAGQHLSPPRAGDSVPRVTVSDEVLHQRRHQLLSTLFQSPDVASPHDTSHMPSTVPRLDVRRHKDVFALRGDPVMQRDGQRSVFAQFQGRPRLLQELIAATMV